MFAADAPRVRPVAHAAGSRFGRHAPALGAAVAHATHFAPFAGTRFRGACRGWPLVAQVVVLGKARSGRRVPSQRLTCRRSRPAGIGPIFKSGWSEYYAFAADPQARRAAERLPVRRCAAQGCLRSGAYSRGTQRCTHQPLSVNHTRKLGKSYEPCTAYGHS
jgi:hypothetical protein